MQHRFVNGNWAQRNRAPATRLERDTLDNIESADDQEVAITSDTERSTRQKAPPITRRLLSRSKTQ